MPIGTHEASVFDRYRTWIQFHSGWRRRALAFTAGCISVLAFAPVFFAPVLFVTLPCLFWLIDGSKSPSAAAGAGWWFGFGYFFLGLLWVGEAFFVEPDKFALLMPFAITILPAGLALFWAAAAAACVRIWPGGVRRIFVFAMAFSIAEWMRGHLFTGLPWNLPGYALTYPLTLMQSASLFGVYGLTALAFFIFTWPMTSLAARSRIGRRDIVYALMVAVLPAVCLALFGTWRLAPLRNLAPNEALAVVRGVNLRVVQPSIPQREKWLPEYQRRIFEDHLQLSLTDPSGRPDGGRGISHVVWPEAAMPFFPLEVPEALKRIGDMLGASRILLTGAIRREPAAETSGQSRAFNSLIAFGGGGAVEAVYDKIHLVPFGEFLPFESLLRATGLTELAHGHGSFGAGIEPRPILHVPGLPPAIGLICYEALFPGTSVQGSERASLLINVTNDGWFGNSWGPRGHFYQTRVRAVEEGLPLVRAANNGISAIVDPYGRVLHLLEMNERGVIDATLPVSAGTTLYARFGDMGFALLLVVLALAALCCKPANDR